MYVFQQRSLTCAEEILYVLCALYVMFNNMCMHMSVFLLLNRQIWKSTQMLSLCFKVTELA